MADPARYMAAGIPAEASTLIANDINSPGTINVTPTTAPLVVTGNTGTPASYRIGATLVIIGGNGLNNNIESHAYGAGGSGGANSFVGFAAQGTPTAPTAVISGQVLSNIRAFGYGGTGYAATQSGAISLTAVENFTDTANGTRIDFVTTAAGGIAHSTSMTLQDSGVLTIGATAASGATKLQVTGGALLDNVAIGTSAGPTITSGSGAPSGTQPNGSIYLRTDGAANTRFYVSEGGGTWAAIASA